MKLLGLVSKYCIYFTQYTIQLHPLRLQYGLALSAKLRFSVCFMSYLVYSVFLSIVYYVYVYCRFMFLMIFNG